MTDLTPAEIIAAIYLAGFPFLWALLFRRPACALFRAFGLLFVAVVLLLIHS